MELLFIVTVLLSLTACQAKIKDGTYSLPSALSHWNHKLPTSPIPTFLLNRLTSGLSLRNHTYHSIAAVIPYNLFRYTGKEPTTTDSSGTIFFLQRNLGIGNKFTLDLERWKDTEKLYFSPAVVANEIPFSTQKLSVSLDKLHIDPDSVMAGIMRESLEECERTAMIGESRMCVTSLESMIDYTTSLIGTNDVNVFATNASKTTKQGLQQYSIVSIPFASKPTSRVVACHTIGYAYLVHFCHHIKDTRMFQLSLQSDEGNIAEIVAVCHSDTSEWSPEHISFKILNVKPGGEAICHFMTEDGLVWIGAN